MSKKIIGTTILVTAVLFGAYGAFAYTSIDGTTNDRNTDNTKGDVDQTQASTCLELTSDGLRYRANDASTGGEVTELQDFLIAGGFLKTQSTGYFGLGTFAAVKQFQRSTGLNPTGYVGVLTKAKIKSQSCAFSESSSASRSGMPQSDTSNSTQGNMLSRPVACTMEARFCPDGTMMPRDYTTCKWLDTKCGTGQGVEQLKQPQTSVNSAIKRTLTLEEQQRDYACQKQKTVCDTSTANYNGYACKETTALCDRLTAAAAATASAQTDPATTTKIFKGACLYAAPPTGCGYIPGPNYEPVGNCGMVLSCPGPDVSATLLNGSGLKVGNIGPGGTGMACTMVMRFCPDGVTAMPRDASCGWHPELCTGTDRPVGGSQPAPVLQSF